MISDWILRVERVRDGSGMRAGEVVALPSGVSVLGRGIGCDVVLPDPGISRRHALVRATPTELEIEAVGDHGVYLDGARVSVGRATSGAFVQLGGVLLRAHRTGESTRSSEGPMSVDAASVHPRDAPADPVLKVDARAGEALLVGVPLRLRPAPMRLLDRLARRPGAFHAVTDLGAAMWPEVATWRPDYVHKNASYVRRAVVDAVADPRVFARLDAAVRGAGGAGGDARELARELVKARRGVGYRLTLEAGDVLRGRPRSLE